MTKDRNKVLQIIKSAKKIKRRGINILFYGLPGTGKTELCKNIAQKANLILYSAAEEDDQGDEASRRERLTDLKLKQKLLEKDVNVCILFDEAEDVMNRGFGVQEEGSKVFLNRLLENNAVPVFWTTNNISNVDPAFLRRITYAVQFKELPEDVRSNIWKNEIRET